MKTVNQLLEGKGHDVWKIRSDATVFEALKLLAEKDIGALPVIDGDDLVGIFSERDYARKVVLVGKSSRETRVSEIMTTSVNSVRIDTTIQECMALMTERHIRHLPVQRGNSVVGVISIGDVVKAIIAEQGFIIEQLEGYITGSR